jgi:hypothetical protein
MVTAGDGPLIDIGTGPEAGADCGPARIAAIRSMNAFDLGSSRVNLRSNPGSPRKASSV